MDAPYLSRYIYIYILDLRSLRSLRFPGSGFSILRPQISFLQYIDLNIYSSPHATHPTSRHPPTHDLAAAASSMYLRLASSSSSFHEVPRCFEMMENWEGFTSGCCCNNFGLSSSLKNAKADVVLSFVFGLLLRHLGWPLTHASPPASSAP